MPAADWYPDPDNAAQLRYWDGERWTDNHAPAVTGLRNIGDFLTAAFTTAWKRAASAAWLWATLQVPLAIVSALIVAWALNPIRVTGYREGDFDVEGVSAMRLVLMGIALLFSLVAYGGFTNALRHQMFHAHRGHKIPWATSAVEGVRRVPRWIGWGLAAFLAIFAVMAVFGAMVAGVIIAGVWGIAFLIVPVGIAVMFYVGVRLYFTLSAIAVAPTGSNPLSISWNAVKGVFWPVLGRVLLWAIIASVIGSVFNTVVSQLTSASLVNAFNDFEIVDNPNGIGADVILDGRSLESVGLTDFIGGAGLGLGLLVLFVFGTLTQAVTQALSASADTSLYLDLDAPYAEAPTT